MARDIFSIPGMLAKVKRLFSSAKLGDFFEYLTTKEKAREHFQRQALL